MNLMFNASLFQQKQFEDFFDLLICENNKFNLTAITEQDEVCEKHFYDSIQAIDYIKQNANVVDVGAGAGFPSIPLKIMRDDLKMTLVDSLNKRVNFLKQAGEKLKFNDFVCVHSRAEDFAKKQREFFDVGVARAVAPLSTLCELVAPLVKIGGYLILYKGSNYQKEIDESQNAFKELGLKMDKIVTYTINNAMQNRVLIILNKTKHTPLKYPRPQNKPKLQPL